VIIGIPQASAPITQFFSGSPGSGGDTQGVVAGSR